MNTQNDRLYDIAEKKSAVPSMRLVKGRKHFSEHVMVSVAVSKSGKTDVHFVDKGRYGIVGFNVPIDTL